jgi:hypothetical protein
MQPIPDIFDISLSQKGMRMISSVLQRALIMKPGLRSSQRLIPGGSIYDMLAAGERRRFDTAVSCITPSGSLQ